MSGDRVIDLDQCSSWLKCVALTLEDPDDVSGEVYDEISLGLMDLVERLREKRFSGNEMSLAELVEQYLSNTYTKEDGEVIEISGENHMIYLAITAAIATKYLADDYR